MPAECVEYVLGVDVGGTNIRMGIVSSDFEIKRSFFTSTNQIKGTKASDFFLDISLQFLREGNEKIKAVCFGFPSIISKDKQHIVQTPNIAGMDNVPFVCLAEKKLGLPVFLEKDVNLLLMQDIASFGLIKQSPVLGFYIGTGFGNAMYINGEFFSGANGAAGELGHIPLYRHTEQCECGNIGCAETRASGRYFSKQIEQKYPGTCIKDFFYKHGADNFAQEFVESLSYPVATEMNLLDPFAVILGGGLIEMNAFPKETLMSHIKAKLRRPYPLGSAKIYFSSGGQNTGILGAARYAFIRLAQ